MMRYTSKIVKTDTYSQVELCSGNERLISAFSAISSYFLIVQSINACRVLTNSSGIILAGPDIEFKAYYRYVII